MDSLDDAKKYAPLLGDRRNDGWDEEAPSSGDDDLESTSDEETENSDEVLGIKMLRFLCL